MPIIQVRSVYKKHTACVELGLHQTVADLRRQLAINEPQLALSKLLFRGRVVPDKAVLSSLALGPTDFLTSLPTKSSGVPTSSTAQSATPQPTSQHSSALHQQTPAPSSAQSAQHQFGTNHLNTPNHSCNNTTARDACNPSTPASSGVCVNVSKHSQQHSCATRAPRGVHVLMPDPPTRTTLYQFTADTAPDDRDPQQQIPGASALPTDVLPTGPNESNPTESYPTKSDPSVLNPIQFDPAKYNPAQSNAVLFIRTQSDSSHSHRTQFDPAPRTVEQLNSTAAQSTKPESAKSNSTNSSSPQPTVHLTPMSAPGGGFLRVQSQAAGVQEHLDTLLPGYWSRPNPSPAKPSSLLQDVEEAALPKGSMVPRCLFSGYEDCPGGHAGSTATVAAACDGAVTANGAAAADGATAAIGAAATHGAAAADGVAATHGAAAATDCQPLCTTSGACEVPSTLADNDAQKASHMPEQEDVLDAHMLGEAAPAVTAAVCHRSAHGRSGACHAPALLDDSDAQKLTSHTASQADMLGALKPGVAASAATQHAGSSLGESTAKAKQWSSNNICCPGDSSKPGPEVVEKWRLLLGACLEHVRRDANGCVPCQHMRDQGRVKGRARKPRKGKGPKLSPDPALASHGSGMAEDRAVANESAEWERKRQKRDLGNGSGLQPNTHSVHEREMQHACTTQVGEDTCAYAVPGLLDRLARNDFTKKQVAAFAAVELPPVLERLLRVFTFLNHTYLLFARQHIQMTWNNSHKVLEQLGKEVQLKDADIRALSKLVPSVVVIKDRNHPHDDCPNLQDEVRVGSQMHADNACNATSNRPSAGTGGVLGNVIAQGWSHGIARKAVDASCTATEGVVDGAGTVLQGDLDSWIIEVMDPGRRPPAAVCRDQLEMDGLEAGLDGHLLSLKKVAVPKAQKPTREGACRPSMQRRERAVRHALAFCTWLLHCKWAMEYGSEWDVFQEKAWHPDFAKKLPSITKEEVLEMVEKCWQSGKKAGEQQWQHVRKTARPPLVTKKRTHCSDTTQLDTEEFLEHLQEVSWYEGQVVHVRDIPARPSRYGSTSQPWSPPIQKMLVARGIQHLFIHQAEAIDHIQAGRHTVVATSTASGKSLCYNIPILEAYAEDPDTCAIYMFPTKALAQDQLRVLREMSAEAFGANAPIIEVYDGDTPQADRPEIRSRVQFLITNPDMLHQSILPAHDSFARVLANLKYIVVDEGHAYKGVFGCHTSVVLRRLRRLCSNHYHLSPCFVITSATIANPAQHAETLLGVSNVKVVTDDGSPHGPKRFVLWNPPLSFPDHRGALTHTEARMSHKAYIEATRSEMRKANALISRGIMLGRQTPEEWNQAIKQSRKRTHLKHELFDRRQHRKMAALEDESQGLELRSDNMEAGGTEQGRQSSNIISDKLSEPGYTSNTVHEIAVQSPSSATIGNGGTEEPQNTSGTVNTMTKSTASPQNSGSNRSLIAGKPSAISVTTLDAANTFSGKQGSRLGGSASAKCEEPEVVDLTMASDELLASHREDPSKCDNHAAAHQAQTGRKASTRASGPFEDSQPGCVKGTGSGLQQKQQLLAESMAAISAVGNLPASTKQLHSKHRTLCATPHPCSQDSQKMQQKQHAQQGGAPKITGSIGHGSTSAGIERLMGHGRSTGDRRSTGDGHSTSNGQSMKDPLLHAQSKQHGWPNGNGLSTKIGVDAAVLASKGRSRPVLRRRVWGVRLGLDGRFESSASEGMIRAVQEQMDTMEAAMASMSCGERKELFGAAGTPVDQRRNSPIVEISVLLAESIQHGVRTIAFCKTRKLCELVMAYTRETLKAHAPHLMGRVKVYRGGYSPQERRQIEADLHSGILLGVAATNALELGVDVGHLDCTLHLGFPGSVASLWQQAGRAGRREQPSLSIYVAFDGPLDQHFMRHPEDLFGRPIETVQVDPGNLVVLQQHILCAATELPIDPTEDERFFGRHLHDAASALTAANLLGRHPRYPGSRLLHYVGPKENPAADVSLRTIDPERYTIVNEANGSVLEEVEANMAFYEVYDGAVYMFQGRPYLCKKLDLDNRVALVRPADVKYYTKVRDFTNVHITGARVAYPLPTSPHRCTTASCESALVAKRFLGFFRVWQGSGEVFDSVDLFLPDVQFDTQAAYVRMPLAAKRECEELNLVPREGLHAAGHAILNILHMYIMCNPGDLGTDCDNPYDTRYRPEYLLLYDKHPGGIGLAGQVTPIFGELLERAYQLVVDCPCTYTKGCPGCIHHLDCGNYNAVLNKRAAEVVLRHALQIEREHAEAQAQMRASVPAVPTELFGVGEDDDELINNNWGVTM